MKNNNFISEKEIGKIIYTVKKNINLPTNAKPTFISIRNLSIIIFLDKYVIKLQKNNTSKNFKELKNDKTLAEKCRMEWVALNSFYKIQKEKKFKIDIIKPVKYIEKYNIIVTKRYYGIDFFEYLEKEKINLTKRNEAIEKYFEKIGLLLADMHNKYGLIKTKDDAIITRIQEGINLKTTLLEKKDKNKLIKKLNNLKNTINYGSIHSININGFQIRNILTDKNFKKLILLDISKTENESIYKMLGAFTATTKIIYQNKWNFPFKKVNDTYIQSLLNGYKHNIENFNQDLFNLYYFQELLALYRYVTKKIMRRKTPYKNIVKKYYLDRVYLKEFYKILNKI